MQWDSRTLGVQDEKISCISSLFGSFWRSLIFILLIFFSLRSLGNCFHGNLYTHFPRQKDQKIIKNSLCSCFQNLWNVSLKYVLLILKHLFCIRQNWVCFNKVNILNMNFNITYSHIRQELFTQCLNCVGMLGTKDRLPWQRNYETKRLLSVLLLKHPVWAWAYLELFIIQSKRAGLC